jgi:UDP-2-acetamido-3-amino-2,3-dideoxy-glucuronate N-acetyltransferase
MNKKNVNEDVFVHETSFIDNNVTIKGGTKIWHFSHISENAKIGKNVTIGQNVFVGKNVVISDGCKIQNNVSVYEGVILKKNVFIGPSVVFTNVKIPKANLNQKNNFSKTIIEEEASIGANSTIICGNIIGQNSFVGAGSVVTKNVSNNSVVCGNPAKLLRYLKD